MKGKYRKNLTKLTALFLVGIIGFETCGMMQVKAASNSMDGYLKEIEQSLNLLYRTEYFYDEEGNNIGEYIYGPKNNMVYSYVTVKFEKKDNVTMIRKAEKRSYEENDYVYFYTYRYFDDKTACFMERYDDGALDYCRSWIIDNNSQENLITVDYDSNAEIESIEYYSDDEEEIPGYRKEEIDGNVLLEACYESKQTDYLNWYTFDEEGRVLLDVEVSHEWEEPYSKAILEYYVYDEQGRCKGRYTYSIVDDVKIQDTTLYSSQNRYLEIEFEDKEYPCKVVSENAFTQRTEVEFDLYSGSLIYTNIWEE